MDRGCEACRRGFAVESDPRRRVIAATLRAVQTFGQPMVGTPEFAREAAAPAWPGSRLTGRRVEVGVEARA